jgi:DNA-binding CsgD family transcriptional regulator
MGAVDSSREGLALTNVSRDIASRPGAVAETLLEREPEIERLRDAVRRAARGSGGLALVEGAAGIGKTALLQATCGIAGEAGMRVLRGRARELEQDFAFGVARQLFEGLLAGAKARRRAELLQGAAQLAAPLFQSTLGGSADDGLGSEVSPSGRPQSDMAFPLIHGLYWLAANLAEESPVLIALDDAHWADAPSLQFLAYLGARCEDLAILVVVTVRSGERSAAAKLLTALRSEPGATRLEPGSLSDVAIATLVRSSLGDRADPEFCTACAHASAGNPFLLHELVAELEAEKIDPVAESAPHIERVRPGSISRAVVARLSRMGEETRNLARAVALLERCSLPQAEALAGLDAGAARVAADRLTSAEVLVPAATLAFVHPLLRHAIYQGIPPAARADGHRRAGLLLATEQSQRTRAGAHLLRSDPTGDPDAVVIMRDAAREAVLDGAPHAAVRLLRRALSEPPPVEVRGALLGELGEAEALARDPAAAQHLSESLTLSEAPAVRVKLACSLGHLLVWVGQPRRGHEVLTQTLEGLGEGTDPSLRAAVETLRVATASVDRELVAEVEPRLPALRALAVAAGPAGRALMIFEGCWRAQSGPYDAPWRELVDRGLDEGRFLAEYTAGSPMVGYAGAVLVLADEIERASALIDGISADAQARGSIDAHLLALSWGSMLALRRGDLQAAESDATLALEIATSRNVVFTTIWCSAILAQALTERGSLDQADDTLERVPLGDLLGSSASLHALLARGRLRLAQGRRADAIADLQAAGESTIVNNPSYVPWRSTLAEVLAGEESDRPLALADEELIRAQELGQPRGIGVALRVRGLLVEDDSGLPILEQAVQTLRRSPARLELARALCDLGAARRRAGQRTAAREPLREALELAGRCGAEPVTQRAHEELLATGAHPRRERLSGPDALTPSERRVAELAASGLTNREIAQALFVTTKTVGTHLGHIYQKLDLQGAQAREQLGERLEMTVVAG